MQKNFSFELSGQEKSYLLDLAKLSIGRALEGGYAEAGLPQPPEGGLREPLGAFVTLKKNGQLRGCIGTIQDSAPLFLTVARMALAAAFKDPRFAPLTAEEFSRLEFEISILGPITACKEPEKVVVGRHGLILKQGRWQGLLLPQVPLEWNWNREEFLDQTCAKAGLAPKTWKKAWSGDGTELYWFEAVVI